MSKVNYDSDFCGSLPLHHINLIQPYGYLMVLDKKDFTLIQASENIDEVLGHTVQNALGTSLSDYIKVEQAEVLRQKFSLALRDKIPLSFTFNINDLPEEFNALVHSKQDYLIVELEKAQVKNSFIDIFQELKFVMAEINLADTIEEVSNIALSALKKFAGFDRVLMYRFDEAWNGTVIAELLEKEADPYLGLKFPASDIPKQARALYQKNPYRLIPSRDYSPVRLFPVINPATHSFIDLSDCNLRSVAAVHLEYMKNMDIQASMSIRVLRNDKLWGLISCHNRQPKYLNYEMCSIFELLSQIISSRINSIESKQEYLQKSNSLDKRAGILDRIYAKGVLPEGIEASADQLLDLFSANGVSIAFDGRIFSFGKCPEIDDIQELVFWLETKNVDTVISEDNLVSSFESALAYVGIASGLLVIPIGSKLGNFIMLFRPEVQSTVNWGGNPDDAIKFETDGKKYHPRNSFKIWNETVKQTSLKWQKEELEIAESLRSSIFEYSTRKAYN